MLENFTRKLEKKLFSSKEQQVFLEDFSALVEDGVVATKAAEALKTIARGQAIKVAEDIVKAVSEGRPVAEGMEGWFPKHITEIIRAGEDSGTLAKTMRTAAGSLTQKNSAMTSLVASLLYPTTVLVMGMVVTVFISKSVLKQFAQYKPVSEWPHNGQVVMFLSQTIQDYWWLAIIIIVGIAFIMMKYFQDFIGDTRNTLDKLPVLSVYRRLVAAQFMETLGLLTANGIVMKQAFKIMQIKASPYLAWHLMLMDYRLGGGRGNIADVLDTGLIDDKDLARLRAVAEAKGFEHALVRQGKQSALRGMRTVKILGKIGGGILLGVSAILAMYLVTSIYSVGSSLATSTV